MEQKTTKEIQSLRPEHWMKKWVAFDDLIQYLDEEIEYLENHVAKANEGIKLDGCNEERIKAWIHEAKNIRREIKDD